MNNLFALLGWKFFNLTESSPKAAVPAQEHKGSALKLTNRPILWYDLIVMARPLRVEYEGAIYHVTARGNTRGNIFLDDKDRHRFLDRLEAYVKDYNVRLFMFCLMSNHFHLVLETPFGNLSRFMHRLQTATGQT